MGYLHQLFTSVLGDDVVYFTTDGPSKKMLTCGMIKGVLATIDFRAGEFHSISLYGVYGVAIGTWLFPWELALRAYHASAETQFTWCEVDESVTLPQDGMSVHGCITPSWRWSLFQLADWSRWYGWNVLIGDTLQQPREDSNSQLFDWESHHHHWATLSPRSYLVGCLIAFW